MTSSILFSDIIIQSVNVTNNGTDSSFYTFLHENVPPIVQTLLFTCFNWFTTCIGAALIFFTLCLNKKNKQSDTFTQYVFLPISISFGGGVMMAASFFSLILPAYQIFITNYSKIISLIGISFSFLFGIVMMMIFDGFIDWLQKYLEKRKFSFHSNTNAVNNNNNIELETTTTTPQTPVENNEEENKKKEIDNDSYLDEMEDFERQHKNSLKEQNRKNWIIFLAMTLHNLPEGLIVGISFAAAGDSTNNTTTTTIANSLSNAILLSLGISIQNIPEGIASTFPIYGNGTGILKSFIFGCMSAIMEPIGGILGYTTIYISKSILPFALSFAGGMMLFVVVSEMIPFMYRSQVSKIMSSEENAGEKSWWDKVIRKKRVSELMKKICVLTFFIGFLIMMCLDVGLS
ncbi:hypothetical protein ABK040_016306 [Willaertia magna]